MLRDSSVKLFSHLFEFAQIELTAAEERQCLNQVEISGFRDPDIGHIAIFELINQNSRIKLAVGVEDHDLLALAGIALIGDCNIAVLTFGDLHDLLFDLLVRNHLTADLGEA